MQQLNLQQMMTDAKANKKEFDRFAGDWRTQVAQLNSIVEVVTTYQKAINKAFRTPDGYRKNRTHFMLPEGVVALEEFEEIGQLRFEGAALVQTLEVLHHAEAHAMGSTVNYKAVLKVDENYFLREMLPQVHSLRNADPDYTIYELTIQVPKGELVAEALKMVNDRINGAPAKRDHGRPSTDPSPLAGIGMPSTPFVVSNPLPQTVPLTLGSSAVLDVTIGTSDSSPLSIWANPASSMSNRLGLH